MSCVCILTPVVIAAWPAFSAAVVAAASSLGYQVVSEAAAQRRALQHQTQRVELEIAQSEIVMDKLHRDQRISVTRSGVTVTFSRDARGRASLCVTGQGHTQDALQAMGEELSRGVVQQYVYQRLVEEMRARQFLVVDEHVAEDRSIHLKVRQWNG